MEILPVMLTMPVVQVWIRTLRVKLLIILKNSTTVRSYAESKSTRAATIYPELFESVLIVINDAVVSSVRDTSSWISSSKYLPILEGIFGCVTKPGAISDPPRSRTVNFYPITLGHV